ncbi:MAG: YdcF family protein [Bacilli bacterium]|nr:YdcF family protein [Bacilli bacterium]
MNKRRLLYFLITMLFIFVSFMILSKTNMTNNVEFSKAIEIILILYLVRVSYGCILYIKRQYSKQKYSYEIIMNLALLIFIIINIFRHVNLLIYNWNAMNIIDIYNHTLESFSYFAMLTLPCIIILSLYSVITNFVLIKKEGMRHTNLLGIFLGIFALFGLLEGQVVYMITSKMVLNDVQLAIKDLFDISVNLILSYLYSLIIATLYCNIKAGKHVPAFDKDFVIILGSKINKDGTLTPLLKGRVDRAIYFGKKQYENTKKEIIYMPSGGKGNDESISEALAMKKYLLQSGIDEKNIIVENKSTNTNENIRFSREKINKFNSNAKVSFSTTNYHVFRSGVIAYNEGMECEGMGSKTKWYFYTNALIREFIANLFYERKKHLMLILFMLIIITGLILIGYYYSFI